MILLERTKPMQIAYYEVLMRRGVLNVKERAELQSKYHTLRAGYNGERRVDREWKEVNVPGLLFHDFSCFNEFGHTHQMDTVFVCKHFVLVVEVKNVSGRIDFDDRSRQFVRTREDGKLESMMNPVDQVKRHRELLEIESLHWPEYVPIEGAIVIANPSCVIGSVSDEVPIFTVTGLRTKVRELVKKYEHVSVNPRIVRGYLESLYKPIHKVDWKLNVPVRNGVFCGACQEIMLHGSKGFICMKCGQRDRDGSAIRQALNDYRVLYGSEITNRAFRDFVGIQNADTAYRILNRLLTEKKGANKARVYVIPQNIKDIKQFG